MPVVFTSSAIFAARSRHSGGVRSVQRMRPERRSSRSYPTMRRKMSFASRIRPSRSQKKDSDDVGVDEASDLRLPFLKIAVFSREIAACDANSFSADIRAGAKTFGVRLFSR